ncbi:primosomal protein N' [Bacterioplanoides sp.]|uniref:primosomal protein N' n=1 Tax=Bacterioplanoides sp. TaxID=2066072 RepID=UPI003B5AD2E0
MSFFVVTIALPVPLRRNFDYLPVLGESREQYQPGQRIKAEFGRQLLTGIVIGTADQTEVPANKLKPLLERLDDEPLVDSQTLTLCQWLAGYYHHSLGEVLELALPTMLRRGCDLTEADEKVWLKQTNTSEPELKGAKQQSLWQLFQQQMQWAHKELTSRGYTLAQLKRLAELDLIQESEQLPLPAIAEQSSQPLPLNSEQQKAVDQIGSHLGSFKPCLLEGVTGSGKTEVYLQLIAKALADNKQVLVLVPEIGLTPQTVGRFRARFDVPVALLHSGLNDRERLQGWRQCQEGKARILIGTRSAIFTPLPDLGLIILDEEHDASFKQQDGLRYSARDFALVRGSKAQVPVVLGSATPALETLHNALTGKYLHLKLLRRAGNAKPPAMKLHSILHQPLTAGFAQPVLAKMQQHLQNGKQVLVFINRRGFAPLLACRQCGWMAECRRCDARLTLHQHPAHLHCHHCDFQQGIPGHCPSCHSADIEPVGQGTEKVEQQLQDLFTGFPVRRVDRDSVRSKQAFDELFDEIHNGGPCILVGTQMLAKGHHFPDVTMVVVLDSDSGLFSADFRGMEHSAQLILQVAGRAGRADSPGEVWIQTLYADHPQLNLLLDSGYHALAQSMLQERNSQQLPPYSFMALLRSECEDRHQAQQLLQQARGFIQEFQRQHHQQHDRQGLRLAHEGVNLMGPFPAIMERRAGRFRQQLQIFAKERAALHRVAAALVQFLEQQKGFHKVRWHLDIDPLDTL